MSRVCGRSGFVLPAALLLLVALTGLVLAGFFLASAELRMARSERTHVEHLAGVPRSGAPLPLPEETFIEASGGYLLLRLAAPGLPDGPLWHRIAWALDPDREASAWRSPVETGSPPGPAEDRVGVEEGPCGWDPSMAPVTALDFPDSPLLGPAPTSLLLARLPEDPGPSWPSPGEPMVQGPGLRVDGSAEGRLIVAPGAVWLAGPGLLRGLVLAEGDVLLSGGAVLEGAVRARGSVSVDDGSRIVGARCRIREALALVQLAPLFPVVGGERLGRY